MKRVNSNEKDECERIADEIMMKLCKVCNNNQNQINELLDIGINIFTDSIKNS